MHMLLLSDTTHNQRPQVALVCESHTFNQGTGETIVTGMTYATGAGALLSLRGREASDAMGERLRDDIERYGVDGKLDTVFSGDWALVHAIEDN